MRGAIWVTPSIRQVNNHRGCRFSPANTLNVGGRISVSRGNVQIRFFEGKDQSLGKVRILG